MGAALWVRCGGRQGAQGGGRNTGFRAARRGAWGQEVRRKEMSGTPGADLKRE